MLHKHLNTRIFAMPDTRGVTSCSYVRHSLARRASLSAHLYPCPVILQHPPLPLSKAGRTPSRHHDSGNLCPTGQRLAHDVVRRRRSRQGKITALAIAFIIPTEI